MRTYLIPTDFSASSVSAAKYAAALSLQTGVTKIILLHAYYVSTFENVLPTTDFVQQLPHDVEENSRLRSLELDDIKAELQQIVNGKVEIEVRLSRLPLLRAILEVEEHQHIDLLVLNSDKKGEDSQVGRNIIKISEISLAPVMVVPEKASSETLKTLVLACDFKNVTETVPQESLKKVWQMLDAQLLVVNVDSKGLNTNDDARLLAEKTALKQLLASYDPQYFFIDKSDKIQGIIDFAISQNAQLIIALPKKYSFFKSFMHHSFTEALAAKSTLPVLLLK